MRKRPRKRRLPAKVVFVFRKPAWHSALPFALLVGMWAGVAAYALLPSVQANWRFLPVLQTHILRFQREGFTVGRVAVWAGLITIPLVILIYRARARIAITEEALIYQTPLGDPKVFRWVDVDEVYIRRIEHPLEGAEQERRILTLYARRPRWWPLRPKLVITNRQLEGYRQAERIAVRIAVPAIAERLKATLAAGAPRIEFARPSFLSDLFALAWLGVAAASAVLTWRYFSLSQLPVAAGFSLISLICLIAGLRRFRRRWYALDTRHLYVIRRGLPTLKIPLTWLREAYVDEGVMVLTATPPPTAARAARTVIRDRRFFRNRGVFLTLIRLLVQDQIPTAGQRPTAPGPDDSLRASSSPPPGETPAQAATRRLRYELGVQPRELTMALPAEAF